MAPADRTSACVAVVAIGFGLAVLAVVRPLGLVHPFGATLVVELVRAPILGGFAALSAWLLTRKRDIDANAWRTRHDPGMGRSALSAWLAATVAGGLALSVGAIPDPTDSYDSVPWMIFGLLIVGGALGFVIGPLFGVIYAAFASRALQRSAHHTGDMLDGALGTTVQLTGVAGAIGALVHASAGELDPFGIALLAGSAAAAIVLAVRANRRADWISRVVKGEVAGWKVVPVASLYEIPDWIDGGGDTGVLFAGGESESSFRTMPSQPTPVAFLDVTGEETLARLGAARVRAFVGTSMLFLAIGATFGLAWFRNAAPPSWGSTPLPVSRLRALHELRSSEKVMCALRSDKHLVCWGSGAGALFGKKRPALRTPEAHPTLGSIRTYVLARGAVCVVPEAGDHRVSCFSAQRPTPTPGGPPEVVSVTVTSRGFVAATVDGAVWQWEEGREATKVDGLPPIAQVAASSALNVALDRDGAAWCWGRAYHGSCSQLKEGDPPRRFEKGPYRSATATDTLVMLDGLKEVEMHGMSTGYAADRLRDHLGARQMVQAKSEACVWYPDQRVVCTRSDKAPPNVVFHRDVREIAGSDDGFCAATTRGLWCWNGFSLPFMQ